MKFGVREICDVVIKAKAMQKVGDKIFYKNEPVLYFDSLKTSSLEGAATTAYAQGGKGNSRLVAWEGERTVTFTMEDALLSPAGFSILSGAGLVNASDEKKIKTHITERTADIEYIKAGEIYPAIEPSFEEVTYYDSLPNDYSEFIIGRKNVEKVTNTQAVYYIINNDEYVQAEPYRHHDLDNDTYYWDTDSGSGTGSPQNFYFKNLDGKSQEAESDLIFIYTTQKPYLSESSSVYIMRIVNDEVITEPFIPTAIEEVVVKTHPHYGQFRLILNSEDDLNKGFLIPNDSVFRYVKVIYEGKDTTEGWDNQYNPDPDIEYYYKRRSSSDFTYDNHPICYKSTVASNPKYYWDTDVFPEQHLSPSNKIYYAKMQDYKLDDDIVVLVDYYTEKSVGYEINITPDKFGGNYYLEASTLFRDTDGVDLPALFIIPNCKIQSNFTFTMASSGDPSTFTFTMDAFPDYTKFDKKHKVLTSIQILDAVSEDSLQKRTVNSWSPDDNTSDASREKTWTGFEPVNN